MDEQRLHRGGVAAGELTQALQKLLKDTELAIRERLSDEPALAAQLRERHAAAVRAERTEGTVKGYNAFADEAITQAAVHWLLGCVFVRFLEDNGWLDERTSKVAWIAGPADRLAIAKDRRTLFLRPDPNLTDRDYLLHVFTEVAKLPGVSGLFEQKHNPLYSLQPTAQGAAKIVEFFQKTDPDTNTLIFDFTDREHRTRFLGDLYQNLSESARKRYALCQTPGFVIDFILDRTLTPALDAFGLEIIRMIDPSCGSGHFLLEAFARIFRLWQAKEPGTNPPALVQRALDAVYGVDLNPFAIEISRFRLLIAALESSSIERLKDAPNFQFNLAAGDSLLHGSRVRGGGIERGLFEDRLQFFYETEDAEELKRILSQPYHVVVGNPPYINVSDSVLREAYRDRFLTCYGKYQLGVPFTERFFDLTLHSDDLASKCAGWMGMIVSNAFMKRSFGKKLIEDYLCHRDLTHVIDTSGVYLPGHGTPTTILLARNQQPVGENVRAVRGIRGEGKVPNDPSNAPVWRQIADFVDEPGFDGDYISVADAPRGSFAQHPWSIGGGGATELKEALDEEGAQTLGQLATDVGITSVTGEDEMYLFPSERDAHRLRIHEVVPFTDGDGIRDWCLNGSAVAVWPYDDEFALRPFHVLEDAQQRLMWTYRVSLRKRKRFGVPMLEKGLTWYEWQELYVTKLRNPVSITFSAMATHNHFILERSTRVSNRWAQVIKLESIAGDEAHTALLGILNSSAACFWLKQVCFPRGGDQVGTEGARIRKLLWDVYYEYDGTKLKQFPIPAEAPVQLTKLIQVEAEARSAILPDSLCRTGTPSRAQLNNARLEAEVHLARMIALQEELDWECYRIYGIIKDGLTAPSDQVPPLKLGERTFEYLLARSDEEASWFQRHHSTPISELPTHWSDPYRKVVERRISAIQSNRDLALIERPEYKRRRNLPTWKEMERAALKNWLLDRVESNGIWRNHLFVSCAQLRDALARDFDWISVAQLYHVDPIEDLDAFVIKLTTEEAVPFLPVLRYTESGLRKRIEWTRVWELQRKEDEGETERPTLPTKYVSKDFQRSEYWRLRGGLDVPKERFIAYPAFERDSDASPVLGWAGWSYLEQARALATYYQRMRTEEGWEPERLKPILAGLLELREWLKQWHDDVDPETGLKLGTYFADFAEAQCQELGFSPQEVLAWQPIAKGGRKKKK